MIKSPPTKRTRKGRAASLPNFNAVHVQVLAESQSQSQSQSQSHSHFTGRCEPSRQRTGSTSRSYRSASSLNDSDDTRGVFSPFETLHPSSSHSASFSSVSLHVPAHMDASTSEFGTPHDASLNDGSFMDSLFDGYDYDMMLPGLDTMELIDNIALDYNLPHNSNALTVPVAGQSSSSSMMVGHGATGAHTHAHTHAHVPAHTEAAPPSYPTAGRTTRSHSCPNYRHVHLALSAVSAVSAVSLVPPPDNSSHFSADELHIRHSLDGHRLSDNQIDDSCQPSGENHMVISSVSASYMASATPLPPDSEPSEATLMPVSECESVPTLFVSEMCAPFGEISNQQTAELVECLLSLPASASPPGTEPGTGIEIGTADIGTRVSASTVTAPAPSAQEK